MGALYCSRSCFVEARAWLTGYSALQGVCYIRLHSTFPPKMIAIPIFFAFYSLSN